MIHLCFQTTLQAAILNVNHFVNFEVGQFFLSSSQMLLEASSPVHNSPRRPLVPSSFAPETGVSLLRKHSWQPCATCSASYSDLFSHEALPKTHGSYAVRPFEPMSAPIAQVWRVLEVGKNS